MFLTLELNFILFITFYFFISFLLQNFVNTDVAHKRFNFSFFCFLLCMLICLCAMPIQMFWLVTPFGMFLRKRTCAPILLSLFLSPFNFFFLFLHLSLIKTTCDPKFFIFLIFLSGQLYL